MAESTCDSHVQARFFTRQARYSVPDSPFSVPANVTTTELNALINSLLNDGSSVQFDFLIEGEFLLVELQQHMQEKAISTEVVVEVEYLERLPAPEPEDTLQHDDWVSAVRSMRDYILTGCYDNTLRLFNTEGELLTTIPAHAGPVKCVAWIKAGDDDDPNHVFVSGSHDETLLVWGWNDVKSSVECAHACRGHSGSVDCVAVSPGGERLASGSWDKMLKIWSTGSQNESPGEDIGEKPHKKKKTDASKVPTQVPLVTLSGHNEGVSAVCWRDSGEVATASWDHSIRMWDVEQAAHKSTLNGAKVYLDMAHSPHSGLLVTASADRHIRLYDPRVSDGAVVKATLTSHTAWVSCVAWAPTNSQQFISGAYDSLLKLWDVRSTKAPLYDMAGHEDKILACDWSIPQYMMSGGADNHLKLFKCSEKMMCS